MVAKIESKMLKLVTIFKIINVDLVLKMIILSNFPLFSGFLDFGLGRMHCILFQGVKIRLCIVWTIIKSINKIT